MERNTGEREGVAGAWCLEKCKQHKANGKQTSDRLTSRSAETGFQSERWGVSGHAGPIGHNALLLSESLCSMDPGGRVCTPMLGTIRAGALGYLVLAVVYVGGIFVARTVIDQAPFDAGTGDLRGSWVIALLLNSGVAALVGGWVCRRVGGDQQAVAVLITILVGLALIVVLTDMLVGPTLTGRAFLEELFGPKSADFPLSELWQGRPQTWFAVASYVLAIVAIGVGARLATKGSGTSDSV